MVTRRWVGLAVALAVLVCASTCCAATKKPTGDKALEARCLNILRGAVKSAKEFVKVHAAEALIWNGYPRGIKEKFDQEEKTATPGYRIGVWRTLAQVQWNKQPVRDAYIQKIREVYQDSEAKDRLTAIETLGKVKDLQLLEDYHSDTIYEEGSFQSLACWAAANSGTAEDEAAFAELLDSPDKAVRGNVGYGLRFMNKIRPETMAKLVAAADKEKDPNARVYLASALYAHTSGAAKAKWRKELLTFLAKGNNEQKFEAAFGLSYGMDRANLPALVKNLSDKDLDARIAASQAILRTLKKPANWGYR